MTAPSPCPLPNLCLKDLSNKKTRLLSRPIQPGLEKFAAPLLCSEGQVLLQVGHAYFKVFLIVRLQSKNRTRTAGCQKIEQGPEIDAAPPHTEMGIKIAVVVV